MKRFAQIAAVAGALSMLVGFVVYSQQKAVQPDGYFKIAPAGTSTNPVSRPAHLPAVAPGSKSQAPLVSPTSPVAATNDFRVSQMLPVGTEISVRDIVASSSKSAVVIKPEQLSRGVSRQHTVISSSPPAQYFAPTGRVMMFSTKSAPVITRRCEEGVDWQRVMMFSSKSAPVITPSTFANQRSVAMVTNPPQRRVAQ